MFKRPLALAIAASTAVALGACSPQNENASEQSQGAKEVVTTAAPATSEASTEAAETDAAAEVTFTGSVVREKTADSGKDMTAIFGTLTNNTDEDVSIVGFTTSLGGGVNEIHETVDGTMQKMAHPLVIPAHSSHELKAGGDHFMVMDYADPILAGDEVTITLNLEDGRTIELAPAPVRNMGAGDENYGADGELEGHNPTATATS